MSRAVALAAAACLAAAGLGVLFVAPSLARGESLPSGFQDNSVIEGGELEEPTVVRFSPDGRVFVAEKTGKILVYDDLQDEEPEVFADLRTEVYDTGDRGLLGLALDPKFTEGRPYVYALYTYDHLLGEAKPAPKWGKPDHTGDECPKPPGADVDACPVSGRLVRLTAEGGGNHAVEEGGVPKENVLVEDWCQQFSSHSIGALQFDSSGALYASGGDGASFDDSDYGQFGWPEKNQCDDPPAGIGGTEKPPTAEGGALRAQDARTPNPLGLTGPGSDPTDLNGSLIRINPDTGEGLPDNPLYSSSLDPNERRIVAYGFRNPFRFTVDPGNGEIYVDNVGWGTFEEIDRFATSPDEAYNSGWPCYEGPGPTSGYDTLELDLCERLYEESGATSQPFFYYNHAAGVSPEDSCPSENGSAISGLAFYEGESFPTAYQGALFFADSVRGCIYVMFADQEGRLDPSTVTPFLVEGSGYPGVDIEVGPEGDLYYVSTFGGEDGSGAIDRISYNPGAPVARLTASPRWGNENPLVVHLDASGSTDPNGEPLTYKWDLDGNGTFETSGGAKLTEAFTGEENVTVAVKVTDETGASSVAQVRLFPGDTPPRPRIDEPEEELKWRVGQQIHFDGFAKDDEDDVGGQEELPAPDLYWKTRLYHCPDPEHPTACHAHPLQVFPSVYSGNFTAPDHDYPSYIEVTLTATDSRGLSATTAVAIQPRTVDLQIASKPPGLALTAGLLTEPGPFTLRVIEGSNITLSAPQTAQLGSNTYTWKSWSDGGARVHTIVADNSAGYTAFYSTPEAPKPQPPNPGEEITKPETELGHHPSKSTHSTTARFTFSSNEQGARFRCKLDKGKYRSCRSPWVYRHLKPGKHVFQVDAVNSSGKADATPSTFRWRVL